MGRTLEPDGDEVAGRPLVVEVGQRLPLGDDQQVEPAVVVEVADGHPEAGDLQQAPAESETSGQPPAVPSKSWAGMA